MLAGLLEHAGAADVRVDFGRRDIGVAEQRLDRAEVRAVLDEVRRERVAHLVGRDLAAGQPHAGLARVGPERLPEPLARHGSAALCQEHAALRRVYEECRAILGEVLLEPIARTRADWHEPGYLALAGDADKAVRQVEIRGSERDAL